MSDQARTLDGNLERVVGIVAAYVSNNSLRPADLPELISSVHSSISQLTVGQAPAVAAPPEVPAVPIKKSVTRDYIVCLEDGKRFKSLRRHLSSFHNMTPEQYRTKWNLPSDHPMVAPSYSATRSKLAKESGLGHVGKEPAAAPEPEPAPAPAKKPGRSAKKSA